MPRTILRCPPSLATEMLLPPTRLLLILETAADRVGVVALPGFSPGERNGSWHQLRRPAASGGIKHVDIANDGVALASEFKALRGPQGVTMAVAASKPGPLQTDLNWQGLESTFRKNKRHGLFTRHMRHFIALGHFGEPYASRTKQEPLHFSMVANLVSTFHQHATVVPFQPAVLYVQILFTTICAYTYS